MAAYFTKVRCAFASRGEGLWVNAIIVDVNFQNRFCKHFQNSCKDRRVRLGASHPKESPNVQIMNQIGRQASPFFPPLMRNTGFAPESGQSCCCSPAEGWLGGSEDLSEEAAPLGELFAALAELFQDLAESDPAQ